MKITDILEFEAKAMKKNHKNSTEYLRQDITDVMMCFRYSDGKMHFVLPGQEVAEAFILELAKIARYNAWNQTRMNFQKGILTPLIDEDEFKVE